MRPEIKEQKGNVVVYFSRRGLDYRAIVKISADCYVDMRVTFELAGSDALGETNWTRVTSTTTKTNANQKDVDETTDSGEQLLIGLIESLVRHYLSVRPLIAAERTT